MSYISDLHTTLYNDTDLQLLVDNWTLGSVTQYMIFRGSKLPDTVGTDSGGHQLTVKNKTVNYYQVAPIEGGKPIVDTMYSISCRAYEEPNAEAIQTAVFNALNRVRINNTQFICTKLGVIPPADKENNFIAPVEVRIISNN